MGCECTTAPPRGGDLFERCSKDRAVTEHRSNQKHITVNTVVEITLNEGPSEEDCLRKYSNSPVSCLIAKRPPPSDCREG